VTRRTFRVAAAAILLLAAALRLPGLDDQSLWSDEIYSVESARWPWPVLLTARDGQPPLYGLILKALGRLPSPDLHGRIVSAVAGVAGVGAMLGLGRAIAGRRVALLAAGLLAISPLHVWYSREGRTYALVTLWSIVGSWCLVCAIRDGTRRAWSGWAATSAAGLATHYLYGPVLLAQAVFLVLPHAGGTTSRRRLLVAAGAIVALALVALAFLGGEAAGVVARRRGFEWLAIPYTAFTFVGGFGLGPPVEALQRDRSLAAVAAYWRPVTAVAATGAALAWASLRALPSLGTWACYLGLWLFVPAAAVLGGAWVTDGSYSVRYLLPALPAFVLLAAAGLARLRRPWGAVALGMVGIMSALSIARDRHDPRYMRDDLRGAAHWLRAHVDTGAPIAVSASYVVFGLRHYDDSLHVAPLTDRRVRTEADAEAALDGLLTAGGWLVLSREWEDDPAGHLEREIARRAPEALVARLPGVRIFRFLPGTRGAGASRPHAPPSPRRA
jgi:mannosyltransferase